MQIAREAHSVPNTFKALYKIRPQLSKLLLGSEAVKTNNWTIKQIIRTQAILKTERVFHNTDLVPLTICSPRGKVYPMRTMLTAQNERCESLHYLPVINLEAKAKLEPTIAHCYLILVTLEQVLNMKTVLVHINQNTKTIKLTPVSYIMQQPSFICSDYGGKRQRKILQNSTKHAK